MRESGPLWLSSRFQLYIALRYFKARRQQAFTSVVSVVSVLGVIVGVAALIIALALLTGFQEDIQDKIIGANAHVFVQSFAPYLEDHSYVATTARSVSGVIDAAPALLTPGLIEGRSQTPQFVNLKGVDARGEARTTRLLDRMVQGSAEGLVPRAANSSGRAGLVLGSELAANLFVGVGDQVKVSIHSSGMITPFGGSGGIKIVRFDVVGIFEAGMYEYDNTWALIPLETAQRMVESGDGVSLVQVRVENAFDTAPVVEELTDRLGEGYFLMDWQSMNRAYFAALQLEKLALFVTISLITAVAALNIAATLVLMIKDKQRDIGILMSLGTTRRHIQQIFMVQGVAIGLIGTVLGGILGVTTALLLDHYEVIRLESQVYYLAYVPFHVRAVDLIRVCAVAFVISFAATLYPAIRASRLNPVTSLRYE